MANYLALTQELEGVVEEAREGNIMRQIVDMLSRYFNSPRIFTQHIRVPRKALSKRDMTIRLFIPRNDVRSKILPHLNPQEQQDLEINGVSVTVYGKEGLGYSMTLTHWDPLYVLTTGWTPFLEDHGFQVQNLIALWLFSTRHPRTNVLRFAITTP